VQQLPRGPAPSFLDALDGFDWHGQAACSDSSDPDAWFVEGGTSDKEALHSARAATAYFTCALCRFRTDYLREALTTWTVRIPFDDLRAVDTASESRAFGAAHANVTDTRYETWTFSY
jgi:hypothetical protein